MDESLHVVITRELKMKGLNAQTIQFFEELLSDFLIADYIEFTTRTMSKKYNISERTIQRYLQTLREHNIISDHKIKELSRNGNHMVVKLRRLRLTKVTVDIIQDYYKNNQVRGKVMTIE